MTRIFGAAGRVRAMLRFEAALAEAEADAGLVPVAVAREIAEACIRLPEDPGAILEAGWEDGTPVIPLLSHIRSRLGEHAAGWLHHGATSQDAVDSGLMLQVAEGFAVLIRDLGDVAWTLADLAELHRATPMTARTFLQHATPTTFGVRAALWLAPVVRHHVDLRAARGSLTLQLGGPSGNLAELGERGREVAESLARRLGLTAPLAPWHTDRSPLAAVAALVSRVAGTMAKIGTDLALLAQNDVGEVSMRPGRSSSMPHKRNPVDAVRAVAAAATCLPFLTVVASTRGHELERGLGGWQAEWLAIPMVFHACGAAVAATHRSLESLDIDSERMLANLGGLDPSAAVATAGSVIDPVLTALRDSVAGR